MRLGDNSVEDVYSSDMFCRYNIHGVVEKKAKEIIKEQLKHFSIIDQISVLFLNF